MCVIKKMGPCARYVLWAALHFSCLLKIKINWEFWVPPPSQKCSLWWWVTVFNQDNIQLRIVLNNACGAQVYIPLRLQQTRWSSSALCTLPWVVNFFYSKATLLPLTFVLPSAWITSLLSTWSSKWGRRHQRHVLVCRKEKRSRASLLGDIFRWLYYLESTTIRWKPFCTNMSCYMTWLHPKKIRGGGDLTGCFPGQVEHNEPFTASVFVCFCF